MYATCLPSVVATVCAVYTLPLVEIPRAPPAMPANDQGLPAIVAPLAATNEPRASDGNSKLPSATFPTAVTVIVWLADVVVAPRLSYAFAVTVCDPAATPFHANGYGLAASMLSSTPLS